MMRNFLICFFLLFGSLSVSNGQTCSTCEYLVGIVENYLNQQSTEQEIETAIEVLCQYLPASYEATCDAFIEAGVPQVIEWINQYENTTVVCTQLGLCGAEKVKPLAIAKVNDEVCSGCVFLMTTIESWVLSNFTINEIENYLDTICSLIPGYSAVCQSIVDYELPTIIAWLENQESPQQVCQQIGLCASKAVLKLNVLKPKDENCVVCQLVVSSVEAWIETNATVEEIEQYLETLCALLPSQLAQECNSIVATEIPAIIGWLKQNYTPQQVCAQLGFCTSGMKQQNTPLKYKVNISL